MNKIQFIFLTIALISLPVHSAATNQTSWRPKNAPQKSIVYLPAMHFAAKKNNTEKITELIDRNIPMDGLDHTGATAVHLAAGFGNIHALRCMIDNDKAGVKKCLMIQDNKGRTPFHRATYKTPECMEALAEFMSPDTIELCDKRGSTPLMYAATSGNHAAVKILLQHGAKPDTENPINNDRPILGAFRAYTTAKNKNSAEALESSQLTIKYLIEADIDLRKQENNGWTVLHKAVSCDNEPAIEHMHFGVLNTLWNASE